MNTKLLGLLAAASLATAACQQDRKVETTTATSPVATTTTTTTTTTVDTMALHDNARRMATRVAEDLKLTDPAVTTRIERIYYTRGRMLNDVNTKYATDTTGRYAAIRQANDGADNQVRENLNNPAYYNTYSANRANYGDGPYSLAPITVTTVAPPATTRSGSVGQGSGVKKMNNENDGDHKTKFENGAKIKRHKNGAVKIKRADGTKIKIDEDGHRTVKKGLFN